MISTVPNQKIERQHTKYSKIVISNLITTKTETKNRNLIDNRHSFIFKKLQQQNLVPSENPLKSYS